MVAGGFWLLVATEGLGGGMCQICGGKIWCNENLAPVFQTRNNLVRVHRNEVPPPPPTTTKQKLGIGGSDQWGCGDTVTRRQVLIKRGYLPAWLPTEPPQLPKST